MRFLLSEKARKDWNGMSLEAEGIVERLLQEPSGKC